MARSISLKPATVMLEDMIRNGQVADLRKQLHFRRISKTWYDASVGRDLLHLAASVNQVEAINFLVSECKFDINAVDDEGNTALHIAVSSGHIEATVAILGHRPNDSHCNKDGLAPFHIAIKQGEKGAKIVSEFVQQPAVNVFVTGHDGYSSLHAAAESNNLKALELIHERSLVYQENGFCRSLTRMYKKFSALHLAARAGSQDALAFMLSKYQDCASVVGYLSGDSRTPLHCAVERGHTECVRVLLKHGADPTVSSEYFPKPIHLACVLGRVGIVKLMVDVCGRKILHSEGETALHYSTTSLNSVELISYLIDNGVGINEVDANSFSPLLLAIQRGSVHAIEELLRQGADPLIKDNLGYNALHRAVVSERMEIFKKIADSKLVHAMASSADTRGFYPIHHALKQGNHEMVMVLLSVTSEVFNDPDGNNYLHLAATFCEEHTFLKLINLNLSQYMLNESNSLGLTPLHCAASGSSVNIVKDLLNYGAVINKDNEGKTPFMRACSSGNLAVAKLLYKGNQCQRDWVSNDGSTALHLAVDGKNPDVITFCLDTGMAITLNDNDLSFFDKILQLGYQNLGRAAMQHSRWEECIDICSPSLQHPILRILDHMPAVYQDLLDQCFTKSDLEPTHRDYWEESNFKCLNLRLKTSAEDYSPVEQHTVVNSNSRVCSANSSRRKRRIKISAKRNEGSFAVINKIIECGLVTYVQHPIIREYIKLKWKGIGRAIRWTIWLAPLLLALFLSIPLSINDPSDLVDMLNISEDTPDSVIDELLENQSQLSNSTSQASSETIDILLFTVSFVLALVNLLLVVLEIYTHGLKLLFKFTISLPIWSHLVASVSTFVFDFGYLVGGGMFDTDGLLVAGALGILAAWFSVGFNLQLIYYLNVGAYVTMVIGTIRLIFIVLATFFFFFLGFAYSFHILVGDVIGLQYDTVGRSLFSTFHSLIATTDIVAFISLDEQGSLTFSVYAFILLSLLIVLLPILFTNLLIGLTIGDISQIQKDAIITRLSIEVHAITSLDVKCIPRSCSVDVNKKYNRRYPNRTSCISVVGKVINNWFTSKSRAAEDTDTAISVLKEAISEFSVYMEDQKQDFVRLRCQIDQLASNETTQLSKMKELEEKLEANIKRMEDMLKSKV